MSDLYNEFRVAALNAESAADVANVTTTTNAALLASTYTFGEGDSYATISPSIIGTPQTIGGKTVSANGEFNGNDVTFPTVTGAEVNAVLIYTVVGGTETPIAYIDLASAITPDGRDILLTWNALGVIRL